MGKNLSRIVFSAGGAFVWAWGKKRPKPGDVLYMSKPEHVAVLEELDEAKGTIAVLEYGQFDKARGKHLGIRHVKPFQVFKNTIKIGKHAARLARPLEAEGPHRPKEGARAATPQTDALRGLSLRADLVSLRHHARSILLQSALLERHGKRERASTWLSPRVSEP
ncbi:MAG: hypothetical protein R3B89_07810 [Polyangiaceae bacterium]